MNFYIIDLKSYGIPHIEKALKALGHTYTTDSITLDDPRQSSSFDNYFSANIADKGFDAVFTFNYFPVISNNCKKHNIKYISWVYDCPHINLYSYTLINPCNKVFIFDKCIYDELKNGGINTVYHLPLAADTDYYDTKILSNELNDKYKCDVSFVGSFYNEAHNLYKHFDKLPDYFKGKLDGLVEAQSKIYGYFFLEEALDDELIGEMQKVIPYPKSKDSIESDKYAYTHYFMARRVTEIERTTLLKSVSEKFKLNLYTKGDTSTMPNANNMGPVDYYNLMPYIFKASKINLNISLKSILSGIPLRAMDIMGCGGFLMSNYQSELMEHFIPGEDIAIFESEADMLNQIDYYLKHDDIRLQIAENGYKKIKDYHSYINRMKVILENI